MRRLTSRLRDADRKWIEFGAQDTTGGWRPDSSTRRAVGVSTPDGIRIALPLSQEELAGWTGLREAVAKAFATLRSAAGSAHHAGCR